MPAPRMTTDEYLGLPEKLGPEELIYGLVRSAASPTPGHPSLIARSTSSCNRICCSLSASAWES